MPRRALYLKVILSEEAPRNSTERCPCGHRTAHWRCKHCSGGRLLCRRCCRIAHRVLWFHRVELWNGRYFQVTALWKAGLKLHLGHQGMPCPSGAPLYHDEEGVNGMFKYLTLYSFKPCLSTSGRGRPQAIKCYVPGGWT